MTRAAAALAIAAVAAGCGGSGKQAGSVSSPATQQRAPASSSPAPAAPPTATTNTPPTKHRTKPQPLGGSSTQPLRVTSSYTCNGKRLRGIAADGPVKVEPAIVKPGQSFTVTVTDPSAKVALVSLAGVAPKPIQVSGRRQAGHVAATLKMPRYAGCGNKLLEVEGDVSAEAYVGVRR